ncbi:MAG: outer membrane beta-barrel protein [Bacteroidales bacterium]
MKKILVLILVAVMAFPAINAQFTKVGGGLTFSSGYYYDKMNSIYNKGGNLGLSVKGLYKITVPIQVSPSLTFFHHVQKDAGEKDVVTTMMFDLNGHYIFNSLDKFEFYGLAGLDVLLAWKTTSYPTSAYPSQKENDNVLGLNLGAGSYMKITDQFDLYLEAKYIISKYSQFMLNAGILINIDWLKKHENTGIN